jgi:hypothetical protein
MIPVTKPTSWFSPQHKDWTAPEESTAEQDLRDAVADQGDDPFVRPFMVTEGRTRPLRDDLRIETMVITVPAALSAPLRFEQRRVVELCQSPMSLAEIGAVLRVPLGVARVLVADLAAGNYVQLREPTELPVHVIERIRDLVRAL